MKPTIPQVIQIAIDQTRTTHAASQWVEASALMADVLHRAIHDARFDAFDTPSTGKSVDHIARGAWRSKGRNDIRSSGYSIRSRRRSGRLGRVARRRSRPQGGP